MAEMKFCFKCGTENAPDKKFCKKCGAPLQTAIPKVEAAPTHAEAAPAYSASGNYGSVRQFAENKKTGLIIGIGILAVILIVIAVIVSSSHTDHIVIKGVEYSTSLTELNLSYKNLTNEDIKDLDKMTNLTDLKLYGNKISDISSLKKLKNLISLNLNNNQINDISLLKNLTNLTYLDLGCNQISDISPLNNLINLTDLGLDSNRISDISSLENLTNLTDLRLWNNQISDISSLKNLINLKSLYLYSNQISDISPLKNLTNLESLRLDSNQISDISPLKNLTNLTYLRSDGNPISESETSYDEPEYYEPAYTEPIYNEPLYTEIFNEPENHNVNTVFRFDGGYIDYTEYQYYDEENYTQYINYSAKITLDKYPASESKINKVLAKLGNLPSESELAKYQSSAPDYGYMSESNQIISVYAENNMLFLETYYIFDGGGGTSLSVYGGATSYVFDITTGEQLELTDVFNNFDKVKQIAVDYGDQYVKNNVPYEHYANEPYYDRLLESEWYNEGSWSYNGSYFTVHFGMVLDNIGMYKITDAEIPASEIRSYMLSPSQSNNGKLKLSDVVGYGFGTYAETPDVYVDVTIPDISEDDEYFVIYDLESDIDYYNLIRGYQNSLANDDRYLGYDENEFDYYSMYYNSQDLYWYIRGSFSEDFVTDSRLKELFSERFTTVDNHFAWKAPMVNPTGHYDYDNASVVSYSDTNATVWIAYCGPIEASFDAYVFDMVRENIWGKWEINDIKNIIVYNDVIEIEDDYYADL